MPSGNETTTKFRVDISELKKGIQDANRQIKLANAEFKAASAGMDDWSKSADGISAKIAQLQKVLQSQKSILASYEKQLELVEKEYGKSSKEAVEMRIKLENQKASVKNTEKSLQDFERALADVESGEKDTAAQTDKLDDSLKESKKAADESGKGFTVFKSVLADLVATGIKAAIKGLKDLASTAADSFKSFDEGRDKIIALTGATGESADDLMDVYKGVASSVSGDFSDIGSAIGELSTRFGVSGKELETLSSKFLKFAKLNESNVASSVDDVQKALSAFGLSASDAGGLLDVLNKVAQDTGVDVSTLTKGLIQNGTAFQEMGLNIAESASLMGQMEKSGANAETVMNGLRKALKNATKDGVPLKEALTELEKSIVSNSDSTKGLQAAYDAFGKSGDQIYGALKNGTLSFQSVSMAADDYRDSIDKTYEGTLDASDKVALAFQSMRATIGDTVDQVVEKYGPDIEKAIGAITPVIQNIVQWLGEKIPPAIETIRSGFDKIAPVVQNVFGWIKDIISWLGEKIPTAIESIKGAFDTIAPVVQSVFGWILDNKDAIIAAIAGIGAAIVAWNIATVVTNIVKMVKALKAMGAASAFAAAKQWLLNTALFANPIGLVVAAIAGLVAAFVVLWKRSEKFRNFWLGLWENIKKVFSGFVEAWGIGMDSIVSFFSGVSEKIKEIWKSVKDFFSFVWDGIKAVFNAAIQALIDYFQPMIDFYKAAWNIIKELAAGCWEAIKAVWSVVSGWFNVLVIQPVTKFFSGLWNGIKNAASTTWNFIKGVWAVVSGWFNNTIVQPVSKFFTGMWDKLKSGASGAWEGIKSVFSHVSDWFKDVFSKAWQKVKDVFSTGGKVFDGIKDGIVSVFKTVVNAIIRGINKVVAVPFNAINGILERIQGVSIAGIEPFKNLIHRLPVPEIPQLSQGGVLKRGQVGLLEGDGTEAVVPLEDNKRWIAVTAAQLKKALESEGVIGGGGKTGGVGGTTYNFTQYNTSPKALSRLEIYRQSKNLLLLKGAT